MYSSFSIAFTETGALIAFGLPLVVTTVLWGLGRLVPPAVRVPGYPAGISGFLLVLLFVICVSAAIQLFSVWIDSAEVLRVISMDSSFAWPAVKTLLPGLAAAGADLLAGLLLTLGRSRLTLWAALICLWMAGPGADVMKAWILGIPFDAHSGFFGISLFTIISTLYLLFSNRAAYTYGFSSARRMARGVQPPSLAKGAGKGMGR